MTLFASFVTTVAAERAAAALLDRGAQNADLSIVSHESGAVSVGHGEGHAEEVAKHGLTTTTGADAAFGAAKGLSIGAGLGVLGAIAALLVPGVGLVVGAGALATAIASTAAGGAVAGGLVGFLKDQGMGDDVAAQYHARIAAGGAILALQVPTGELDEREAEALLVKYEAVGVFTSYPTGTTNATHATPHVVDSQPLESLPPLHASVPPFAFDPAAVVVTRSDPGTGYATEGYVDDAAGVRHGVRFDGTRPYLDPSVTTPMVATASLGTAVPLGQEVPIAAVTPTRSDPATGLALEGYVEDPVTGTRRAVRFEHGRAYYVL